MSDIHLGIAFDKNYLVPFYALVTSIFENNRDHSIVVHAIATGLTPEETGELEHYFKQHQSAIRFYQIDEQLVQQFVVTGGWTPAVYYRLYFPFLVPANVERLLYLDTDTIVVNDLQDLYECNLDAHPVGAVYDNYVKTAPQLGIHEEGEYFNSGMLVIDIRMWKEQKISEKSFEYLVAHPGHIKFVDQDALNAVLVGNWKKLDYKYNVLRSYIPEGMSRSELTQFLKDKVLLHFTLDRPWKMLCRNPYRYLYHAYLSRSPYKGGSKYDDFSLLKMPNLISIRILELYFSSRWAKIIWRNLKSRAGMFS